MQTTLARLGLMLTLAASGACAGTVEVAAGDGGVAPDSAAATAPSAACEYRPPRGEFAPKVDWAWSGSNLAPGYDQVMMAPMVANLTDDNGDGKIDRNDVPDIVFNTFGPNGYTKDGVLRAISGDGSGDHFAVADRALATTPGAGVAIADIDGDMKPEIVTCAQTIEGQPQAVIAFEHDGTFKWRTSDPDVICGSASPASADLDGDGVPEVIVRYAALEGPTGATRWVGQHRKGRTGDLVTVADLDDDGKPEVVGGNVVFDHTGKIVWDDTERPDGRPAIADLDGDGKPEIVTAASGDHSLYGAHHDGTPYFGPVDINQGKASAEDKCDGCGGGAPTIADFDGDGRPEIAAAGGWGYVVFEDDGQPKWFSATQDLSSRVTGSSVFDFEGDGTAEVVYADELQLRIYDGSGGDVLFSACNTSGTLWEYPVIVDVDNDGHAEIVVANNNYTFKECSAGEASATGIRVFSDTSNNWVRTRRIWNQHTYHVTNIDEDGRVPAVEEHNWTNPTLNNFRQNVQPDGIFDAPDLQGEPAPTACDAQIRAEVTVKNDGAAKVAAGLQVTLYADGPEPLVLQTVATRTTLEPGQSERVSFAVATPAALRGQRIELFAVVDDDGTGSGQANECREDNNRVALDAAECLEVR